MNKEVIKIIKEYVPKSSFVVLAFSGGPDSVYLLHILLAAQKEHDFNIVLAHFNHKLRGGKSDLDENFSRNTAKKHDIKFEKGSADIKKISEKNKLTIEEAARKKRYEFLRRIKNKYNARFILTAHHLDDNLETFLLNFLRGSGLKGLKAMKVKGWDLLRPLLYTKKSEILSFLKKKNIKYRTDASNKNINFTRNRIRLKVIPELEKIQPNLNEVFFRTWKQLVSVNDYMDDTAADWIEKNNLKKENYQLPRKKFKKLHPALKSKIIHRLYEFFHKKTEGISTDMIERAINLIEKGKTGKKIPFGGKTVLSVTSDNFLCICKEKIPAIKPKKIKINGKTDFEYGEITTKTAKNKNNLKPGPVCLDYSKLNLPLYIRSRKPGDFINPLGMKGRKKIKDILIDKKVPAHLRKTIPVFEEKNGEIVAVGEKLISENKKVDKNTEKVLNIYINKLEKHSKKGKL
jgi:tRNA(Ile)-lysidine synthase